MRISLIFLAFSVLLLFPIRPIELESSIQSLKETKNNLLLSSDILEAEMMRLESNLAELSKENVRQRNLLEERRKSIEKWLALLEQQKMQLEQLETKLSESDVLRESLRKAFETYDKLATSQIRLWKVIAIGEAVVIVGGLGAFLVISLVK